jgi:uncharacterized protein (TIGR02444 family)
MPNPLWDYSCATYALGEVASICMQLQDESSIDVNVLLYAAWLGSKEQRVGQRHIAALDAQIASWRERVIIPLRALRRQLRDYPQANAWREEIKSLELRAERQQQDIMYEYYLAADDVHSEIHATAGNLALVARFFSPKDNSWGPPIEHLGALLLP